jgi:hypothetical protein
MSASRVIFFDGVDGAGKTTRANLIRNSQNHIIRYFRSTCQIDSKFANRPVNLEESLKHDWRILYDFITQTYDEYTDPFIFVDRGFISSFVYSKIFRKVDLSRYLIQYTKLFKPFSEFWLFFREDESQMSPSEVNINQLYHKVDAFLDEHSCVIKRFSKTSDWNFITNSFLNLDEEIHLGHFDSGMYDVQLGNFILENELKDGFIISDLDGVLLDVSKTPIQINQTNLELIKSQKKPVLIVTGRPELTIDWKQRIQNLIGQHTHFILNNRNLGMSSRILKEFCISRLRQRGLKFKYYEDRSDVFHHIFPPASNEKVGDPPIYEFNNWMC